MAFRILVQRSWLDLARRECIHFCPPSRNCQLVVLEDWLSESIHGGLARPVASSKEGLKGKSVMNYLQPFTYWIRSSIYYQKLLSTISRHISGNTTTTDHHSSNHHPTKDYLTRTIRLVQLLLRRRSSCIVLIQILPWNLLQQLLGEGS